jgi:hypothetical protein
MGCPTGVVGAWTLACNGLEWSDEDDSSLNRAEASSIAYCIR